MARPDPRVVRIINAHISADAQIRQRVRRLVTRVWDSLDNYRDADIARFVNAVVPVVVGSERRLASMTDAYLATLASQVLGGSSRPLGVRPAEVSGAALRGVEPDEVYHRAGVSVWAALAEGTTLSEAAAAGRRRALSMATTDLQLAKTHTARAVFSRDDRVVGHRRVLTGSEDCGLCVVASTQRYHREELQPIHGGCDCDVEPIYGREDPGQVIDPDTLEQTHAAIEERFGVSDAGGRDPIDYRKLLVVREHGELGPVLTVKGQHFTSEADLDMAA